MAKLVITADIHGSVMVWEKIRGILRPDDTLAVAGDLFDTKYRSRGEDDYKPDFIKNEFSHLPNTRYYVYGNCDTQDYMTGYSRQCSFQYQGFSIILNHGHRPLPDLTDYHIIIEGHSHIPRLDTLMGKVFLNPGSPFWPRSTYPSYATLADNIIRIIDFSDNRTVTELHLKE